MITLIIIWIAYIEHFMPESTLPLSHLTTNLWDRCYYSFRFKGEVTGREIKWLTQANGGAKIQTQSLTRA